jgi:uncharacterized protein YbcC (UPF0753/DUF2309 family)
MGWEKTLLIALQSHGSHSANNPFGSSLDLNLCSKSDAGIMRMHKNMHIQVRHAKNPTLIPASTNIGGAITTTDEILLDSEFRLS